MFLADPTGKGDTTGLPKAVPVSDEAVGFGARLAICPGELNGSLGELYVWDGHS